MNKEILLTVAWVLLAAAIPLEMIITAQVKESTTAHKTPEIESNSYRISGPFSHSNLTVFLIHGKNQIAGKTFLTLQEALEQKKVVVYETRNVNELAIENLSNDEVFVQSGDIVKGGQQDRMLAVDLIVPAKSGRMPIAAFCVEQGRWSRRGSEQAATFSGATDMASTKDLKLAAKRSKSQREVWKNVSVAQEKLSENVGSRVTSADSVTSLQLTVENRKVQETAESYIKGLSDIVKGKTDVIGYAFAINGKINSADVYASSALFKKLWPKLLKANAVEAIAELKRGDDFEPVTETMVQEFLSAAEKSGTDSEKAVTGRVTLLTRESKENILFETRDQVQKGSWIHRNYIRK